MSAIQWKNFFVGHKFAKNSEGHLDAEKLWGEILTHDRREAYYCAFDLEPRTTFKGYVGLARPALGLVSFDFDGADALKECREFVAWLGVEDVVVFFSGSKGFHVGVPEAYFGLEPSTTLPARLGDLAAELNKRWPTLDTTVYNANRKFRVPGSKHDKTGLYKTQLTVRELAELTLEAIRAKAVGTDSLSLPASNERAPLPQLSAILTQSKDKKYGSLGGDKAEFTPYEKQKGKKCIEAMLKDRAPDGHKQNRAVRIISDLYNTGVHMSEAQKIITTWCETNNIKDDKVLRTVEQIYGAQSGENYSFGCNDEYKRANCSGKCVIYKNLSIDVRPKVIDAPAAVAKQSIVLKTEAELAKDILQFFDGRLCQQERCLFIFKGTHWIELKPWEQNDIKIRLQTLLIGEDLDSDSKRVESLFKTLMYYVPMVPTKYSLFKPSPAAINFLNGTLHLVKTTVGEKYSYKMDFMPHKKEDYLINVLPFDYSDDWSEQNTEFLNMLSRIFSTDEDKEDKIRAIQQMYGACLVPRFPRIFYLNGGAKTGKSTLIKLAMRLVSEDNISGVDPTEFKGFAMESMIGKLVNAVTDVVVNETIVDSRVKQIIDQVPMHINRKGTKYVYATLPALHIFGGNGIPMTKDGSSGAHERRWTFIQCNHVQVQDGVQYNKEFDQWVWEHGPRGILNFALMGLKDLLDNYGHYVVPDSGREAMTEWQRDANSVGLFLQAIDEGEVFLYSEDTRLFDYNSIVIRDDKGRLDRTELYRTYKFWAGTNLGKFSAVSDRAFYKALLTHKLGNLKSGDVRYILGLTKRARSNSEY